MYRPRIQVSDAVNGVNQFNLEVRFSNEKVCSIHSFKILQVIIDTCLLLREEYDNNTVESCKFEVLGTRGSISKYRKFEL